MELWLTPRHPEWKNPRIYRERNGLRSANMQNTHNFNASSPANPTAKPLKTPPVATPEMSMEDYAELPRLVQEQGLLDRQLGYYTLKMASTLSMLTVSIAILFITDNTWIQLANAVFLAFIFGQAGYIGHDAGHLGVCRSEQGNRLIAYGASFILGMSQSWWRNQHNQHHRTPNNMERDPHTQLAALAFSEKTAGRKRGILRFVVGYQAYYFLPLTTLESLSLKFSSALFLLKTRRATDLLELGLIALSIALYSGLLLYALSLWQALAFALVQQALFGLYYGLVFAPNHKGMLVLDPEQPLDFVRTQVLTSRNIKPNCIVDFLYGGLNYQIEHHLFTMMPRNNLGKAKPIVQNFCRQQGIPYYETSPLRSYREILSYLHRVAAPLRNRPSAN